MPENFVPTPTYRSLNRAIQDSEKKNPDANLFIINEDIPKTTEKTKRTVEIPRFNPKSDNETIINQFYDDAIRDNIPELEVVVTDDGKLHYKSMYCNPNCLVEDNSSFLKEKIKLPRQLKNPLPADCIAKICFEVTQDPTKANNGENFINFGSKETFMDTDTNTTNKNTIKIMEWTTIILSMILIILCIVYFYNKNYK
jgi:hypothetical protein